MTITRTAGDQRRTTRADQRRPMTSRGSRPQPARMAAPPQSGLPGPEAGLLQISHGGEATGAPPALTPFLPAFPDHRAPQHVVAVVSGGLDSTTLAYWLASRGIRLTLLSVDYGQRHRKEISFARRTAAALHAAHHVADLGQAGRLLGGCALTDPAAEVPDGHYTAESMRATVVPNRNALMLDIAVGLAIAAGADAVAVGAHAGDHAIYPDCRPEFLDAYQRMVTVANDGFLPEGFVVLAPFIRADKAGIAALAARLGVPVTETWSCYRGGTVHCGSCGTCVERREAFGLAGLDDPTVYGERRGGEPGVPDL
jgi:7-cyano-7-deazaguanine synthase